MAEFDILNGKLDMILARLGYAAPPVAPAPPAPQPAPAERPTTTENFMPFGYPLYPPAAVLDANTGGKGVNHWCTVNSTPIVVTVVLPGLQRIDTVATADSPTRTGTNFHLALKDGSGAVVRQQTVVNGATILFDGLEGAFTLAFWTDDPANAWVVYR